MDRSDPTLIIGIVCSSINVLGISHFVFLAVQVITSCNHTKDELLEEVENFNQKTSQDSQNEAGNSSDFQYLDHVQTYPTIMFGGIEGSRVATVSFLHG